MVREIYIYPCVYLAGTFYIYKPWLNSLTDYYFQKQEDLEGVMIVASNKTLQMNMQISKKNLDSCTHTSEKTIIP